MDVAEIPEQLEVEEPLTEQEQGQEHKPRLEVGEQLRLEMRLEIVQEQQQLKEQETKQQLEREHKMQLEKE